MEILKNDTNLNFVINTEQNFRTDLGWSENFMEFEKEVLEDIINPAKNYETVRYIHRPYDRVINTGLTINQSDIWFNFYFVSGSTYVQDYRATNVGITLRENELMLRQSTESFFRLEFYKTPQKLWDEFTTFNFNDYVNYKNNKYKCISTTGSTNNIPPISGSTIWWSFISENELACEPPTRQNRRFVNAKNLSLPLGEKFLYTSTTSSFYIHIPIFTGSNYRNKENMYLFWFDDESNLEDTNLSGTTTLDKYVFGTGPTVQTILFTNEFNQITQVNIPTSGITLSGWTGQTFTIPNQVTYHRNFYHGMNTFFMTAKFFNGKDGSILDFTNHPFSTTHVITEEKDMYYQVDFDNYERTYQIYEYSGGTKGNRVGMSNSGLTTTIDFYEKGGGTVFGTTSIPTATPSPTPTNTPTPTPSPTPTVISNDGSYLLVSSSSRSSACNDYNTGTKVKYWIMNGGGLQTGNVLCQNNNCSTKALNGFYSDGTNYYEVGYGGTGTIISQGLCSTLGNTTIGISSSASCRTVGSCSDNSTCGVRIPILFNNGRPSSTQIFVTVTSSQSGASVSIYNDLGNNTDCFVNYTESSGSGTIAFTLTLKTFPAGEYICDSGIINLSHNNGGQPWSMLGGCITN
jgi:hypothetical protein